MVVKNSAFMVVAALVAGLAVAQDGGPETTEKPNETAKMTVKTAFTALPLCRCIDGAAEVRRPGGEWEAAEEGKFYPLGCSYRTAVGSRLVLAFGAESSATIEGDAEFGTRQQALDVGSRTIVLVKGTVNLSLASNLPEGAFFVTAPGFCVKNLAGESRYDYELLGDGDKATVRCVTGMLGIEGRHFEILAMHAANEVVIRTAHDNLATMLYGTSGDYVVKFDQGVCVKDEIGDDGSIKKVTECGSKEWRLSPATKIIINRSIPAIGNRMSVHTMAFDAAGALKTECCFCEGRAEVNSGELVAKDKVDGEELAKRAAEATETTAAADAEDAPADEKKENNNNENSNQE